MKDIGSAVDMIVKAHELGMLTRPYVFDEDTATQFTQAGADVVVAHVNTTVAGSIGTPEDAQYVLSRTKGVADFCGASSIERLTTETSIEEQTRFKRIQFGNVPG